MKASIILLAGGIGRRMGSAHPKQFLPLEGQPIALHSFYLFRQMPEVDEIIVVCAPEYRTLFPEGTLFATPGKERQDSVFNGLQQTSGTLICIHDAARPMVTEAMTRRVLEAAAEHGAATVGMPVKFTVKEANDEGFVQRTPDRKFIWEIQTPQALRRDLLEQGFALAHEKQITVTDDASLAELVGHPVKLVKGAYSNIKITTPEDLILAEQLTTEVLP